MIIRALEEADASDYRRLRLEMLEASPSAFSADLETALTLTDAHFRARVRNTPDSFVFGAFSNGALIGGAGGRREDGRKRSHLATVWGMYVSAPHRGTGIGMRLLDAVTARLAALPDIAEIRLAVTAGNDAALSLYERAGFEVYAREPDALRVDGVSHDELLMRRSVNRPRG